MLKRIGTPWLIHIFALLHAATTVACTLAGLPDSLFLTALTMALTIIICIRRNLTTEFSAIGIVLVNVIGYILGNMGARLLGFCHPLLQHALSTFLVTELLGWMLDTFAKRFHPSGSGAHERNMSWKRDYIWLIFAVILVFGFRVFFDFVFNGNLFKGADIVSYLLSCLENAAAVVLMIVASIAFIQIGRKRRFSIGIAITAAVAFLAAVAVCCAFIVTLDLPFHLLVPMDRDAFTRNFLVSLLLEATVFSITYMVTFSANMQKEVVWQREQRHQAEFRYMTLKNQVDPHFLFNSLNVLDSIVKDSSKEEASRYIHKLAHLYHYMMQHEGHRLVSLRDEVEFATAFCELLQIRFPEGLRVEYNIREEDLSAKIVPCTLQLLLGNGPKHNATSAENPLVMKVSSDGKNVVVSNNLIPRVTPSHSSTGLGLQYIRNQYRDLAGKEIKVEKSATTFTVTLPLLED
ncbi:MAG: histidine kinase [Bacteroidales bacterium]|nr:histidine kinase [Bacteroidales bacterium]